MLTLLLLLHCIQPCLVYSLDGTGLVVSDDRLLILCNRLIHLVCQTCQQVIQHPLIAAIFFLSI